MSPKPVTIEAQVLAELRKSFRLVEPSSVLKGLGSRDEVYYLAICAIERRFRILISERDRHDLKTVADLVRLVESRVVS